MYEYILKKMLYRDAIVYFFVIFLEASGATINETEPRVSCTVTSYDQVAYAIKSCSDITIDGIEVPPRETLNLALKDGAKLKFKGIITFGHAEWNGPLVYIEGKSLTVEGVEGHKLNGQGELYWDKIGNMGTVKPHFMRVKTSGGSLFSNINILNCPTNCIHIKATDLTISEWNIDCSAGDTQGGHNTDGFDISSSSNIVIKDTTVKNQDDCIVVLGGSNMQFSNIHCSGTHGLSLSVGSSQTSYEANVVSNVTFSDCTVENSTNAIHIKTHKNGGQGAIKDVTYDNIRFSGVTNYGISIQEDYADGGSTGEALGNVPITNLKMSNIKGTLAGENSMPVYIFCGENGCDDWIWSEVSVTGGSKTSSCNFKPKGYAC